MKPHHAPLAVSLLALSLALPAHALESFIGEYTGTLQKAEGKYRGEPGTPCRVRIKKSDMYGGSLAFSINDEPAMLFEVRNIAAAEAENSAEIMVLTPNTGERIKLKARPDGTPVYLLLIKTSTKSHTTDVIACEALKRK
jgi:hypothetical protein